MRPVLPDTSSRFHHYYGLLGAEAADSLSIRIGGVAREISGRDRWWKRSRHRPAECRAPCEAWLVSGRRAGKSFILALIAVFLAVFPRLVLVFLDGRPPHDHDCRCGSQTVPDDLSVLPRHPDGDLESLTGLITQVIKPCVPAC